MKSLLITTVIFLGHLLLPNFTQIASGAELPHNVVYLSPIPASQNHNPETGILIRFSEDVDLNIEHTLLRAIISWHLVHPTEPRKLTWPLSTPRLSRYIIKK